MLIQPELKWHCILFILSTDRENAHLSLERNCTNIQQFHYKNLLESYEEKGRINFFLFYLLTVPIDFIRLLL